MFIKNNKEKGKVIRYFYNPYRIPDSNLNSPRESLDDMMEAVVCREDELPEEGYEA